MLPTHLVGIYSQYKQDTDSVASWLASTAKACGYPADLLTSTPAPSAGAPVAKSARLKGKQRKQARQAAKGTAAPAPVSTGPKHIIAVKDFLPLANFIAGRRSPAVSVPDVFSTTINRVITLRSGFGDMMNAEGVVPNAKSDEKHGYFVGILEAVRNALRPLMTPVSAATAAEAIKVNATASWDATADLGSRFSALNVEEPSQAFINDFRNATHERPKQPANDPVTYEAEQQTSFEEIFFAFTILLQDLNRIRAQISQIWSKQRDGLFDLAAAAIATNTAVSLARGLIEEVTPIINQHPGGYFDLIGQLYTALCITKGEVPEAMFFVGKDGTDYKTYDLTDSIFMDSLKLVKACVDALQPSVIPLIREGFFGRYDPTSDRTTKNGFEKFREDRILITEMFTELITVIRSVPDYPVEDEFLRSMRDKCSTRPYTVSFHLFLPRRSFSISTTL
jgi:hypothetical protein